jgi:hypothetical protein
LHANDNVLIKAAIEIRALYLARALVRPVDLVITASIDCNPNRSNKTNSIFCRNDLGVVNDWSFMHCIHINVSCHNAVVCNKKYLGEVCIEGKTFGLH